MWGRPPLADALPDAIPAQAGIQVPLEGES